jgi:1-acyl-sn-glycerol-3-phosphate acyltransferase
VLIFPEGTRSPPRGLRRFKAGAFEICLRAGVPLVPILISCDPPTLFKGLAWYALPKKTASYDICQLSTIENDTLGTDSHRIAQEIQAMFQQRSEGKTFAGP